MFFTIWFMFWNISRLYLFFFSIQNIKNNCYIIFLKHFLIIFFWWIVYFFPVIFINKRLNFCYILWIVFYFLIIYHDCYSISFSLIGFIVAFLLLSNQENLYMIHYDSDLFYDIYNTITENNQGQTNYLSLIVNYFDIYF